MKKKTKKQELVAKPHLLLLVFLFVRKRVKTYLPTKDKSTGIPHSIFVIILS